LCIQRELAAKTLERYRGIVRDHLIPELGGIPLARISAAKVNDRMIPATTSGSFARCARYHCAQVSNEYC
jgi:hypothetical protein